MADRTSGRSERGPVGAEPAARSGKAAARLGEYRRKRDFAATPEPSGGSRRSTPSSQLAESWDRLPKGRRFCVQLHRASRLHYDFRLEYRGALLSWAVPKGPSMDPSQRRLAVEVEDHPVDYGSFEDVIPSGYGAGTVLIWDTGTFAFEKGPKGDAQRGLREGHLDFRLEGRRLRGGFSLIRMERGRPKEKPQWLLVKRQDEDALSSPPELPPTSVKTGRTLDQVAAHGPALRSTTAGSDAAAEKGESSSAAAPRSAMPSKVAPMLATLVDAPFSRPGWLFELKYDGVRAMLRLERGKLNLRGRSGRDESPRYPELLDQAAALGVRECLLDGEIVALDSEGKPSFSRLQSRIQLRPAEARRAASEDPVVFMAFDLLFADGRDLRGLPLQERKQALRAVLRQGERIRYADEVLEHGEALYREVERRQLEGVIAKRADSTYQTGRRSRDWLKIKVRATQDCVICGYLPGKGRRQALGALLLGVYSGGELVAAGRVGTGFSDRQITELRSELDRRRRQRSPWSRSEPAAREAVWVVPELVCEVEHAGWTVTQKLRQPSFRAIRPDVPPQACLREEPVSEKEVPPVPAAHPTSRRSDAPKAAAAPGLEATLEELAQLPAKGGSLQVGARTLSVTHLNKPLWPGEGITKRDLIRYHLEMADVLLPQLRGRAVVARLFPDGIGAKSFWRRALPGSAPAWIPRWTAHPGTPTICPLIEEPAALVWLANQAAIDIHPWHSRRDRPTQPDWAVFDLDPGPGAGFGEVVEVARLVKAGLDQLKLRAWLKTTGQSGLHIYVPLRRGPEQDEVREWVGAFASEAAAAAPQLVTESWAVRGRRGRVRIDYTQNVVGKTLAAVYSPRPAPGAPVSTPIDWDELEGLDPTQFNLATVPERVRRRGDLFQPVLSTPQRLPALGGRLELGAGGRGSGRGGRK